MWYFRVLSMSEFKRVDDEDSHGGKIEVISSNLN